MDMVKTNTQVNAHAQENDAAKVAAKKAAKAASAKAFSERQAALKVERQAAIKALQDFAAKNKVTLPEVVTKWIEKETATRSSSSSNAFFNKVFGESPKVGDKVTLLDYMKKTLKAKADLDRYVKQWAEKGIIVEFTENKGDVHNSTYTIKKM